MPDFVISAIVKPFILLFLIFVMALGVYLVRRFCSRRWQALLLKKLW